MAPSAGAAASSAEKKDDEKKYPRSTRRMTPELLMEVCKERNMWSQPHLNTQLYLNYKGFDTIEGLEDYSKVRALHLGNNNIAKIEGLDRMSDLRTLHLENNRITAIENLDNNLDLRQLNLEANAIKSVSGIAHLAKLEHLNLSRNIIEKLEDLEGLKAPVGLANIDVSNNQLEVTEGVLEFWMSMADKIKVLRYQGNPGVRHIEHYRKRLVNGMPQLTYLDERPVFPVEQRSSAAWASGGIEAMHAARREYNKERDHRQTFIDPERREFLTNMRKVAIARIEREQREREAAAEAKRQAEAEVAATKAGTSGLVIEEESAATDGDPEALEAYAKAWRTKLELRGPEGMRAQLAKEEGAQAGLKPASGALAGAAGETPAVSPGEAAAAAREASTEDADKEVPQLTAPKRAVPATDSAHIQPERHHHFAPPSRGGAAAEGDAGERSVGSQRSVRWANRRSAEASDFLVSGSRSRGTTEGLQDRQFDVLGGDDWMFPTGPSSGDGASSGPGGAMGGRGAGQRGKTEPEVMPQIWERLAPAAREAEKRCLEMNFAHRTEAAEPASDNVMALD